MNITKSRNQREGRYCCEANRARNEPLKTPFMNRRTYGANARRITQQFFNNAERYDFLNDPENVVKAPPLEPPKPKAPPVDWNAVAHQHYKDVGFDPSKVTWNRYRMFVRSNDARPVIWPPAGPYWITGATWDHEGKDVAVVVAYMPEGESIQKYWPEVTDKHIDVKNEGVELTFTERFIKPNFWPF